MLGLSLMNFCQMNNVLTHIEPKLVVFQGLWRDLGLCLGASGHHIGASWLHIGCLWLCWLKVGASLVFLRGLGLCLGASGHHIGPSWLHVGCLLAMLAPSLGHLEAILAPTGGCGTHPGGIGQKHWKTFGFLMILKGARS